LRRCAPSACKHTVSGSISLPSRGAFHLSLTVLYSIGHQVVFSLRRWASYLPTKFLVLDGTLDTRVCAHAFVYRAFTLFRYAFQSYSTNCCTKLVRVRTPYILLYMVWALTCSLATTRVIVGLLSFPPGTKMFQFPGFPSLHYEFM